MDTHKPKKARATSTRSQTIRARRRTAKVKAIEEQHAQEVLLSNRELVALYSALVELEQTTSHPLFAQAVVLNIERLRPLAEQIHVEYAATPEYREYEAERDRLCRKHARKDVKGNPIVINDSYAIADQNIFRVAIGELRRKFREPIEHYEAMASKLVGFLTHEGPTISLCRVRVSDCPELTPAQMRDILPMIAPVDTTSKG